MEPEEVLTEETQETPEALPELEAPRFAAKTVLNAERQLEASKAVSPKIAQLLSVFLIGFAVLALGILLWLYFAGGDKRNLIMAIIVVPLIGYMVYSRLVMPKKAMLRWEEKLLNTYGCTELHLLTEFYDKALAQTLPSSVERLTPPAANLQQASAGEATRAVVATALEAL